MKRTTPAGEHGQAGNQGGQFARMDDSVRMEYPHKDQVPSSKPVQGHGGSQHKPTLSSFSLQNRVAVVTGAARGLGMVMSQAMIESGADVAIVDLNSRFMLCYHFARIHH